MNVRHRHQPRGRAATVLLGLLLGLALAVTPASAQSRGQMVRADRLATAAGDQARSVPVMSGMTSTARLRHAASTHRVPAAQTMTAKARKKSGFFKKLGIFLLVLLIVVILIVVLVVYLLVRVIRRAFRRGRTR